MCELHVYFDEKGYRLGVPSLKKLEKDGGKTNVIIEADEHILLTDLANMHTSPSMYKLQNLHQIHQYDYENQALNLINEVDSNQINSIESIEPSILKAKELLAKYEKTIKNELYNTSLTKLIDSLEWKKADLLQNTNISTEPVVKDSLDVEVMSNNTQEKSITDISINEKPVVQKTIKTSIEQLKRNEFDSLINTYATLYTGKTTEKSEIDEYLDLYNKVELANLEISSPQLANLYLNYSGKISALYLKIQKKCTQMLIDALVKNCSEDILKLINFIKYLPHASVVNAVESKNIENLKLLLKHGVFPLNQIRCEYNNNACSLLEYSFYTNDPNCFNELLKNGVSVFSSFGENPPLVYQIHQDKSSIFYEYLQAHYSGKKFAYLQKQLSNIMEKSGRLFEAEILKKDSEMCKKLPEHTFSRDILARKNKLLRNDKKNHINKIINSSSMLQNKILAYQEANELFLNSVSEKYKKSIPKRFEDMICAIENNKEEDLVLDEKKISEILDVFITSVPKKIKIFQLKDRIEYLTKPNNAFSHKQAKQKNKEIKSLTKEYYNLVESFDENEFNFLLPDNLCKLKNKLKNISTELQKIKNFFDIMLTEIETCDNLSEEISSNNQYTTPYTPKFFSYSNFTLSSTYFFIPFDILENLIDKTTTNTPLEVITNAMQAGLFTEYENAIIEYKKNLFHKRNENLNIIENIEVKELAEKINAQPYVLKTSHQDFDDIVKPYQMKYSTTFEK